VVSNTMTRSRSAAAVLFSVLMGILFAGFLVRSGGQVIP
jgi:hypothetical protein